MVPEGGPIFSENLSAVLAAPGQAGAEASVQPRIRRTFCGSLTDAMLGAGRARLRSISFFLPFSPAPTPFQLASCTIVVPEQTPVETLGKGRGAAAAAGLAIKLALRHSRVVLLASAALVRAGFRPRSGTPA